MTSRLTAKSPFRQRRRSTLSSSDSQSKSSADGHSGFTNSPASDALFLTDEDDYSDPYMYREELYDAWDFALKDGDTVWVKSSGPEREVWFLGLVQKSTKCGNVRGKQCIFYMVRYRRNLRKFFSPFLGDIKPDTPHVRILLKNAGCETQPGV